MKKKPLILIVDDNRDNISTLAAFLDEENYDIAIADGGKQALDFIWKRKPDLILLDIMMPEMNGLEVCRQVKSNGDTKRIPIIFLTAKSETEDIVMGFKAGGADYVTKPYNSLELMARIETHLKNKILIEENEALRGIIPICSECKKIRDDEGYWHQVESFLKKYTNAELSHSLCRQCADKLYGKYDWYDKENKEM